MGPNPANQSVALPQHERCLGEVGEIEVPGSKRTRNYGEVGKNAISPAALDLSLVEGAARGGRFPTHLRLRAVNLIRLNVEASYDLWHVFAGRRTLLTADLRVELRTGFRATGGVAKCLGLSAQFRGKKLQVKEEGQINWAVYTYCWS